MEDHHVDRPDVEARQRVQLTGTNRSFDLIVLIIKERMASGEWRMERATSLFFPLAIRHRPLAKTPVLLRNSVLCRPGGSCEAIRPDPIPNSAVKRLSANGTLSQDTGE